MGKFNNNKLIDVGYKAAGGILSSDGESNDGGDSGFAWFAEKFGLSPNQLATDTWLQEVPYAASLGADAAIAAAGISYVVKRNTVTLIRESASTGGDTQGHNETLWLARDASLNRMRNFVNPFNHLNSAGAISPGYGIRLFQSNNDGSVNMSAEIYTDVGSWQFFYKEGALVCGIGDVPSDMSWNVSTQSDPRLHAIIYQYIGLTAQPTNSPTTTGQVMSYNSSGNGTLEWSSNVGGADGTDGADGVSPIALMMTNSNHAIPVNNSGGSGNYIGSGTDISVFSGGSAIAVGTSNDEWEITNTTINPSSSITIGAQSANGANSRSFDDHSAMSADAVTITYEITIHRSGTDQVTSVTQSLSKQYQGPTGTDGGITVAYTNMYNAVIDAKDQTALDVISTASSESASSISATTASTKAGEASVSASSSSASAAASSSSASSAAVANTSALGAETGAGNSASSASGSATAANTSKLAAETAETNAETAESNASGFASTATTQASAASGSASTAAIQATAASVAKTNAETAETNAETAESNALGYANTASTQASGSLGSASAANASKLAAETAETNAETAESNASGFASSASTSASAASVAKTAAETAETNAELAETNASASASTASTSANTATTKASEASSSASAAGTAETNASGYASAASISKTNAETAETNAETAESNASGFASAASSSASAASTSKLAAETAETNAETAETNAETAESNASGFASTATTQAGNASGFATAASGSSSAASTSASTANTSKLAAETAETNASNSANAASTSASNATTAKTAAETAETNAGNSASAASTSASAASSSFSSASAAASAAATQASAAATAKVNAETAETNAELAETNAGNSASAASTSAGTASTYAGGASTYATNSYNSYISALTSANTATTKASTATSQANIAITKAGEAATSTAAAGVSETNAETAKNASVVAKDASVTAQGLSEAAKDLSVTAKDDSITAKNASVSAKNDSVTAKDDSVTAKNAAEAAETAAEGFRDELTTLTTATTTVGVGGSSGSSYNSGTGVLTLDIPTGATGSTGSAGAAGAAGATGAAGSDATVSKANIEAAYTDNSVLVSDSILNTTVINANTSLTDVGLNTVFDGVDFIGSSRHVHKVYDGLLFNAVQQLSFLPKFRVIHSGTGSLVTDVDLTTVTSLDDTVTITCGSNTTPSTVWQQINNPTNADYDSSFASNIAAVANMSWSASFLGASSGAFSATNSTSFVTGNIAAVAGYLQYLKTSLLTVTSAKDLEDMPVSTTQLTAINLKQDNLGISSFEDDHTKIAAGQGTVAVSATAIHDRFQAIEATDIHSSAETGGSKFLRENGSGGCTWETVSSGGGATTISGLTDTNIQSKSSGDMLRWNGMKWINTRSLSVTSVTSPSVFADNVYSGSQNAWILRTMIGSGEKYLQIDTGGDFVVGLDFDNNSTTYKQFKILNGAGSQVWGVDEAGHIRSDAKIKNAAGTEKIDPNHSNGIKFSTHADIVGNITLTGTVDGVNIASRDAILTSTTATAGAALPKTGGTITGDLSMDNAGSSRSIITNNSTTANRVLNIPDVSGIIATTNKVIETKVAAYHSSYVNAGYYTTISGASTSESNNLAYYSFTSVFVVPYDGKVLRICSTHQTSGSKSSNFELYINKNPNTQIGTTVSSGTYTSSFCVDCASDWIFSKGDSIAIKRTDTAAVYGTSMTVALEYDTTT